MQTPAAYLESVVIPARDAYNGFNLIVGDVKTGQFAYVGNRGAAATTQAPVILSPYASSTSATENNNNYNDVADDASAADAAAGGVVYGLSNATLDIPWPKVELGKRRLREEMQRVAAAHAGTSKHRDAATARSVGEGAGNKGRRRV